MSPIGKLSVMTKVTVLLENGKVACRLADLEPFSFPPEAICNHPTEKPARYHLVWPEHCIYMEVTELKP